MSEDEIQERYIAGMGMELGTLISSIYKELALTSKKWDEFKNLFSSKKSRINLMTESAPTFFSIVQDVLINDILLSISRLTDSPNPKRKFKNASLEMVLSLIDENEFSEKVKIEIDLLKELVQSIRVKRDKYISHIDYDTLLSKEEVVKIYTIDIENSLLKMFEIFNSLESYFNMSVTNNKSFPSMGDALDLLRYIDLGLEKEAETNEKIQSGNYTMKDVNIREI